MYTVKDSFGTVLKEGDKIAWIANPSKWDREIRKGVILRVEKLSYKPQLVVKAEDNPYGGWYGEGYKAAKNATLVCCRDISGPSFTQRGTHYMFPRVMKLS